MKLTSIGYLPIFPLNQKQCGMVSTNKVCGSAENRVCMFFTDYLLVENIPTRFC